VVAVGSQSGTGMWCCCASWATASAG
jgi:hypothetical protein